MNVGCSSKRFGGMLKVTVSKRIGNGMKSFVAQSKAFSAAPCRHTEKKKVLDLPGTDHITFKKVLRSPSATLSMRHRLPQLAPRTIRNDCTF